MGLSPNTAPQPYSNLPGAMTGGTSNPGGVSSTSDLSQTASVDASRNKASSGRANNSINPSALPGHSNSKKIADS